MSAHSATLFNQLHSEGLLMLANCWDGGSARLAQAAGSAALATSSAAVAWAHGFADGGKLPRDLLLATVSGILRVTSLPLSVDIENGYSDDPATVADLARALIEAGIAGINIEDGNDAPETLCRKIAAIRAVASASGVDLFINTRCDVYLRALVEPALRVEETLRRAALYAAAGASGLFAAGVTSEDEIAALAKGSPLPLNVMARPGLPPLARLAELGARRVSAGSAISEAMLSCVDALSRQFLATGAVDPIGYPVLSYGELNRVIGAPSA